MFDNYTFTIFSYHPTMVLAFSSQDNSICLRLQFSDICFNKSLFPDKSFQRTLQSRAVPDAATDKTIKRRI